MNKISSKLTILGITREVYYLALYLGLILLYFFVQFNISQPSSLLYMVFVYQAVVIAGGFLIFKNLVRSKWKKWPKSLISFVTALIMIFFSLALITNLRIQYRDCSDEASDFLPFSVVTQDNIQISGIMKVGTHDNAVILLHGVADNKTGCQFLKLANVLSEEFDVYLFDFRGYGQSSGASTFGHLEILDLKATFDFVAKRQYSAIGLIGNSMGGTVAIRFAAQDNRVNALIIAGTPANFTDLRGGQAEALSLILNNFIGRNIYRIFTQIPVSNTIPHISPDKRIANSPIKLIGRIAPVPVLIIHGEKDKIVNLENAYLLYDQAHQPKDLLLFENGGHSITELSQQYGELFRRKLLRWLDSKIQ